MPIDTNGVRADAIMDPRSVASRMNSGKLYDGYFASTSRGIKKYVIDTLTVSMGKTNIYTLNRNSNAKIKKDIKGIIFSIWEYIVGYLKILDNNQYHVYKNNTDYNVMLDVISEIIHKEFYVMIPIDNKKNPSDIVLELDKSVYKPIVGKVKIHSEGLNFIDTNDDISIETVYMLVLSKIADTWLATNTAKTNHFGVPISTSRNNKRRQPWSPNPVKTGETETRLYSAYVGREAMAELRDRSVSMSTHKHMYAHILKADKPTNIEKVIDRTVATFNNDNPVNILESILNVGGVKTIHVPDKEN